MDEPSLLILINKAKTGDTEAMMQIVRRFTPLLKKHSSQLGYDEAYSDLVMWIVTAVNRYKSLKIENEGIQT